MLQFYMFLVFFSSFLTINLNNYKTTGMKERCNNYIRKTTNQQHNGYKMAINCRSVVKKYHKEKPLKLKYVFLMTTWFGFLFAMSYFLIMVIGSNCSFWRYNWTVTWFFFRFSIFFLFHTFMTYKRWRRRSKIFSCFV